MVLPNLIIAGAQKCATSSMFDCLAAHPQCRMSDPKEPTFFSRESNLCDLERYEACFTNHDRQPPDNSETKIVAEASTSYMAEPYVPARIRQALGGQIKFIFMVRRPADRMVSAFWHVAKRGHEHRRLQQVLAGLPDDLDAASHLEQQRVLEAHDTGKIDDRRYVSRYDDPLWSFHYIANSRYSVQIERYKKYFSAEQLKVVVLEELIAQPKKVFASLAEFLEIDAERLPSNFGKVINQTQIPRKIAGVKTLHFMMRSKIGSTVRRRMPLLQEVYQAVSFANKPQTSDCHREFLHRLFSNEKHHLSNFLGRDLTELNW